jgi:hypothetical protein
MLLKVIFFFVMLLIKLWIVFNNFMVFEIILISIITKYISTDIYFFIDMDELIFYLIFISNFDIVML